MKNYKKSILTPLILIGTAAGAYASLTSPQEINRDARVYSDREVVMQTTEISETATSTPKGPAYVNRHSRVASQRDTLLMDKPETKEKVTDMVSMDGPTASQLNRHN
jgi:hypothetical protein